MAHNYFQKALIVALLAAGSSALAQTTPGVGIGTSTPAASALLDLTSTAKGLLLPRMTSAQAAAIQNPTEGLLIYRTDGLQPGLWVYHTVGGWNSLAAEGADNLGNHSASQNLSLNGHAIDFGAALAQQLNLWNANYGIGVQPYTLAFRTGSAYAWYKGGSYSTTQNDPGAGGSLQMLLDDQGRLGLGTASPLGRLDLGAGNLLLNAGFGNNTTRPAVGTARLAGEIAAVGGVSSGAATLGADDGFLRLSAGGGSSANVKSFIDLSGYSQQADMNQTLVLGTGGQERLRVSSGGNVGIGTSTPSQKLEVAGQVYSSTGGFRFPDNTVQTTAAAGDNLGNHTATQNLNLNSSNDLLLRDANHGLGWYGAGKLWNGINIDGPALYGYNGGALGTNQNGTKATALYWNSGGNVGIGTSSPQGRLDVASGAVRLPGGGGSDTWFNYFGDNKNYLRGTTVLADLGGSVGIGTSTPGATLDVPSGSVHLPGDSWIRYSGNNKNYLRGTTILADDAQGGSVGIGTANPTQRLEVSGQVYSSTGGFRFPDNTVQTTAAAGDNLGNHAATQELRLGTNFLSGGTASVAGTSGLRLYNAPLATATTNTSPLLRLERFTTNGVKWPNTVEWALGSYGAGITAQTRLDLNMNDGSTAQPDRTVATFLANGNMGIGTNTPGQLLEVAGQVYSNTGGFRFPDGTVQTTAATSSNAILNQTTQQAGANFNISGAGTVGGVLTATGGARISSSNTLEFGAGVSGKEANAGKIGYQTFSSGLDIVGAGTGSNRKISFFNEGGAQFTGNVGIGTSSPAFPLDVQNTVTPGNYSYVYYAANGQNGTMGSVTSTGAVSIRAAGRVVATEFNATSDRRLKTIIGLSDRAADLALLQQIRITDYQMRDRAQFGTRQFKKVIAQEVEQVFPQAVSQHAGFLPDVYALATSVTAVGDSLLRLNLPQALPTSARAGQRLKLIGPAGEVLGTVAQAASGTTLVVRGAARLAGQQVFVYGLEHADVRSVDYEALSMLNVSATQELARQVAELQRQNAALRTEAAGTRTELQQLKAEASAQTADFAQRLQALEDRLGTQASAK